jgi:hypothetical protein
MTINKDDLVITIDAKRLAAILVLAAISVYTLYSYSVALFAFIAPYPGDGKVQINSATTKTYDGYGAAATTFAKGSKVYIKGDMELATAYYNAPLPAVTYTNIGSIPCKVFITVKDVNDKPVYYNMYSITLHPGVPWTIPTNIYNIPSSASTGAYRVRVLVWSDYLPGGISLTDSYYTKTFTVT